MLTPEQNKILHREVALIEDIRFDLAILHATKDDIELLKYYYFYLNLILFISNILIYFSCRRSLEQLEDLFLLVIVGEFNSGKSSFINALLGQKYLKEGVTPTTNKISIFNYK